MAKFFNTSGPCVPGKHYMIDPENRLIDLNLIQSLIRDERYFLLHAPRQTGKTTQMMELAKQIYALGETIALYVNIEAAQPFRNNVESTNKVIISSLESMARIHLPPGYRPSESCFNIRNMEQGAYEFLERWCSELPKPLVLFIDEIDALMGDALLSVLRQLRSGYNQRPAAFPQSVCLIGLRDIRDYRIYSDSEKRYVVGGSAFNIKEESLTIAYFTQDQVRDLYTQHTQATGQIFEPGVIEKIFELSGGQPWLVNALGKMLCFTDKPISQGNHVTLDHVAQAKERLILRRDVHLDQLIDKLTEPRVARVIQSMLLGKDRLPQKSVNEDQQYLLDLGLVSFGHQGLEIANPIYKEIIPRELTWLDQGSIGQDPRWYVKPDGGLDMELLMKRFVEFYKENSGMLSHGDYSEAAHHLIFMAWLQRIVNGGGTITREYALGRKRMDICVEYQKERWAFELKINRPTALERGKDQLVEYLNQLSLDSGFLLLFTKGPQEDSDELGREEVLEYQGKKLRVFHF